MSAVSRMSAPMISKDMSSVISLPGSAAGRMRSGSPDGLTSAPPGPEAAPASPSPSPDSDVAQPTTGISGRGFAISSRSAGLQSCLESRLRARLDVHGSPEYALTWKHWPMPQGEAICALRASARRISANDCSGWPTPTATDAIKGGAVNPRPGAMGLSETAPLSGWATPTARDYRHPSTHSYKERGGGMKGENLSDQVVHLGPEGNGCAVSTGKRAVLNPEFSRWLIGFPIEWASCAPMAMRSSRRSRPSSSARTSIAGHKEAA